MSTNHEAFVNTTALILFWVCGTVGGLGLVACLSMWSVDVGAKALQVHRLLLEFMWFRLRDKQKLPRPQGLGYAIRTLERFAEKPCTGTRLEPCTNVGYLLPCEGCAARLALEDLGLREPSASEFLARVVPIEMERLTSETGYLFKDTEHSIRDQAVFLTENSGALSNYAPEDLYAPMGYVW